VLLAARPRKSDSGSTAVVPAWRTRPAGAAYVAAMTVLPEAGRLVDGVPGGQMVAAWSITMASSISASSSAARLLGTALPWRAPRSCAAEREAPWQGHHRPCAERARGFRLPDFDGRFIPLRLGGSGAARRLHASHCPFVTHPEGLAVRAIPTQGPRSSPSTRTTSSPTLQDGPDASREPRASATRFIPRREPGGAAHRGLHARLLSLRC
jgi:hypothetical protein